MSIRNNAPDRPGVYGLFNARECLYVGCGDNVRAQLLRHLQETGTALESAVPTGFAVEECSVAGYGARAETLIRELTPRFAPGRRRKGSFDQ